MDDVHLSTQVAFNQLIISCLWWSKNTFKKPP